MRDLQWDQPSAILCLGKGGTSSVPRRRLFGAHDAEQTRAFVKQEMLKIQMEQQGRWNFNFAQGHPLSGRYKWEPYGAGCAVGDEVATGETQSRAPLEYPAHLESAAATTADGAAAQQPSVDASAQPDRQTIIPEFFAQKKRGSQHGKRDDEDGGGAAGDEPSDGEGRSKKPRSAA